MTHIQIRHFTKDIMSFIKQLEAYFDTLASSNSSTKVENCKQTFCARARVRVCATERDRETK